MRILWRYLKPQQNLVFLALILATISQLLTLLDPIIFGKIIDDYAIKPKTSSEPALVKGVLFWLAMAVVIALAARLARAFQDYTTRLAVQ